MKRILLACLMFALPLRAFGGGEDAVTFVSWVGLQGGSDYGSAVPLPPGRTLRLNHYQFQGRYDFFWIDAAAAQTLTFSLAAGWQGIEVRPDGTFVETDRPFAGLQVRDAQGRLLGELDIAGERNAQRSLEIDVSGPQRFYVLVGSVRQGTHKDQFVFRADVKTNFDGGSVRDAGSTPQSAVPLAAAAGNYPENHLTANDIADYFRFPSSPGQKIRLNVVPENPETRLLASLYNEVFQEIARGHSTRPGAAVRLEGESSGGSLYLRVYRDVGDAPTRYAVAFAEELPPLVKSRVEPQAAYVPRFLNP